MLQINEIDILIPSCEQSTKTTIFKKQNKKKGHALCSLTDLTLSYNLTELEQRIKNIY